MEASDFGKKYLLLCLRMNKIIEGYVDAYFGPKGLQETINHEEAISPKSLMNSCKMLSYELRSQDFVSRRMRFIQKTLDAMETSIDIVMGKEIPYLHRVQKLYDIKPELIDDSIFFNAAEKLNLLFEGRGNLIERIAASRKEREVPYDKIKYFYQKAMKILRKRTKEFFPKLLPIQEELSLSIVTNQPWSAYNWYLGNYNSRIDINTDLPVIWTNLLPLAAHEGYPGHHTHNVVREKLLYNERNWFEHSILLVPTPAAVISEGIGNTGIDSLFTPREKAKIALDNLCPIPDQEDLELNIAQNSAWKAFGGFSGNIAIHAHVDEWSDEKLINYGMKFEIYSENRIKQQLKFIRDPLWSTYVFNYFIGEKLIKKKYGENPSIDDFKKLLTHPFLPSDLI
ncbi:hypothetical protein LCGC14_0625650 [marine sediment metagenome]|uniref:DUF885 domain-containing protein n=1 Tax=marine sediment metagenome TaxID=412755 RepID=A0A0F9R3G4_9ZZZZ